jgi:two-component system alkaline phosphatase synthesis response regulator PhoP
LPLTPREYELLQFLLTHRGRLFSRERLLDLVWGVDFEGGARTVDIHIRSLRAKLPPDAARLLTTQRGIGYGFQTEER